jgi:hypothetical protein
MGAQLLRCAVDIARKDYLNVSLRDSLLKIAKHPNGADWLKQDASGAFFVKNQQSNFDVLLRRRA